MPNKETDNKIILRFNKLWPIIVESIVANEKIDLDHSLSKRAIECLIHEAEERRTEEILETIKDTTIKEYPMVKEVPANNAYIAGQMAVLLALNFLIKDKYLTK